MQFMELVQDLDPCWAGGGTNSQEGDTTSCAGTIDADEAGSRQPTIIKPAVIIPWAPLASQADFPS